jgi:predicted nucleic acid-binding protein
VKYLLDSNVISELRKAKPHGAVLAWLNGIDREEIGIPAIVIGELQAGAEISRRQDSAKAAELEAWIDEIVLNWEIVPIDARIARDWGRLMERKNKVLFEDAMIAATARSRGLIVVTRNEKDFVQFGVPVLNPFLTHSNRSESEEID